MKINGKDIYELAEELYPVTNNYNSPDGDSNAPLRAAFINGITQCTMYSDMSDDKYEIIGARFEGDKVFGSQIFATTKYEKYAQIIVNALKQSDESALYHFGYIKKS